MTDMQTDEKRTLVQKSKELLEHAFMFIGKIGHGGLQGIGTQPIIGGLCTVQRRRECERTLCHMSESRGGISYGQRQQSLDDFRTG
jgi:hypothetical protein